MSDGLRECADAFTERIYSTSLDCKYKKNKLLSVFKKLVHGIESIYRNSSGVSILDLIEWANGSDAEGPGANGSDAEGPGANGSDAEGLVANGSDAKGLVANGSDAEGLVANGSDAEGLVGWAVANVCLVDVIIEHYGMPFHGTPLSRRVGITENSDQKTPTLDKFYGDDGDDVDIDRPVGVAVVTDSDDDTNDTY